MVTHKAFVRAWVNAHNEGQSAQHVAKKLGFEPHQVHMKANYLRKQGVQLPQLVRFNGGSVLDVDALNEFIEARIA